MKTLDTDRLILREWHENDAVDLFEFAKSPNVVGASWQPHESIDESLEAIRSWIEYQEIWAIVLKDNNKPIGTISLTDINRHDRYKEIEYVLSEDYQNKGYTSEATKRVLEYAFRELDLMVVAVCHYPYNIQSKRVIEKCGFTYEGTLRKYSRNLCDSVRYSMTKEEWECKYA
ncbi:GNAT family N-acetyltransferase [Vallitalea okinawensis]|uniref:GNAT family N-acetyltransferase n=1 Tax=Vallitalea okinawensis TaxID=2078660 RepID=UPI001300A64F|nr:GNAT family protein [Vallitalea okinawensis]